MSNLEPADRIIKNVFGKFGWNADWDAVFKVWEKVVGKNISKFARAREIGPGQLIVEVSNNYVWHQLYLDRRQLVKKINEYFGYPLVRTIKFELKSMKV